MGDRVIRPDDMATTSTAVATTVPPQIQEDPVEPVAVITLRPTRPQQRKKVVWTEDTVDNENMNKKKSKCCCIYEKPHKFGESDSEDSDDECEHCFGHVERRGKKPGGPSTSGGGACTADPDQTDSSTVTVNAEATVTISLSEPEAKQGPPTSEPSANDGTR